MTKLYLKPVDSFFFKGHKDATAGDWSVMYGIFPPRPSTVYGSLRSSWIDSNGGFERFYGATDEEMKKWMGTPSETGDFSIQAILISEKDEPLLPAALDSQAIRDGDQTVLSSLALTENRTRSSSNSPYILTVKPESELKKSKSAEGNYLKKSRWKQFMLNGGQSSSVLNAERVLVPFEKLGNAIDPETGMAQESMLYRVKMYQMNRDFAFQVFLKNAPDFSNVSFLRLGGENRPWQITQQDSLWSLWDAKEKEKMKEQILTNGFGRIILISPALWANGSRPGCYDRGTRMIRLPGDLQLETVAWVTGRPHVFGGWDMAKGRPKPRRNMVTAGSVIYVKVRPEQVDAFLSIADGFSLSDRLTEQGFGFAVTCSCAQYYD